MAMTRSGDPMQGSRSSRSSRKSATRNMSAPRGGGELDLPGKSADRKGEDATEEEASGRIYAAALIQKILEKKEEGVVVFDENFELNKEIAEALGLSDSDYGILSQTLRSALEDIDDLRAENVEVRQKSDSQLFLKIRSFGDDGAEVQASLEESLRQQLGDDRYASFMLMAGDDLANQYFQFGKAYQTISFNLYDSKNDGARRVRVVDRLHVPQENGEWAVIENKDNFDSMPPGYAPFFELANSRAPNPIQPTEVPQPLPVDPATGDSQPPPAEPATE